MKLNKYTCINYIYKGKNTKLNIIYSHNVFDLIPVYYSDNIKDICIIKTDDESILTVCNKEYANKIGDKLLPYVIIRLLIKMKYNNISNELLDAICINAMGYKNTIAIINKVDSENFDRINNINDNIKDLIKLKTPNIDEIIKGFKFINKEVAL